MDSPIEHVSDTALWVTAARAYETSRPDRLIDDPLAELPAGPRGMAILDQMPFKEGAALGLGLRTRIIDEFILRAIDHNGVDAVLSLGRAWIRALGDCRCARIFRGLKRICRGSLPTRVNGSETARRNAGWNGW